MLAKYKVEIDGLTESGGLKYADTVSNWSDFLPVTQRHKKYHSFVETFAVKKLVFSKLAKDVIIAKRNTNGGFAASTLKIKRQNPADDSYDDLVNGTLDFDSLEEDLIAGKATARFFPNSDSSKLIARAKTETNLQTLTDFDGTAITAFSGDHGETYTLSLTKTEIAGLTEAATSNCEIMLAWEVGVRLAQKLLGRNDAFRSDLLGRTDGEVVATAADGRLAFVAFTTGGLVRVGGVADYPVRMSLDQFFDYLNNIEPVGMGIEYINDVPFLRIEELDYWYDSTSAVNLTINNPEGFRIVANGNRIFGKVLSGFKTYRKANDNGTGQTDKYLESMHTPRSFVTGLDFKTNKTYNIRSSGVASPHLMEFVRNNPISGNEADELDFTVFYIVVKGDGGSPRGWDVDNDIVSTTGVNDEATQKNYLLCPGRTILNHLKLINAALIREYKNREATEDPFTGYTPVKLINGIGNDSASTRHGSEAAEIAENADLSAGVEPVVLEDDLFVDNALTEAEYVSLQSNLKKRVNIVFESVTYTGYLSLLRMEGLNRANMRFLRANPDY